MKNNYLRLRNNFHRIKKKLEGVISNQSKLPLGFLLGDDCRIQGKPRLKIVQGAEIVLANKVVLNSDPDGYHAGMGFPVTLIADRTGARITIGEGSRLHGCCLHAWAGISVGRKCLIAAGSQILDAHGHTPSLQHSRLRTIIQDDPEPIVIEDYCWVGLGAVILKGVHLGEGCIVAANSLVTKGNYPPFSLMMGVPAQVIKSVAIEDVFSENYPVGELERAGFRLNNY